MNHCKKCGELCEEDSKFCSACVQATIKNTQSRYIAPKDDNFQNLIILVLTCTIIGCVAIYPIIFGYGKLPAAKLKQVNAYEADPCHKKERCVIAYLAPWCPSCIASQSFLSKAKNKIMSNKKLGMKLIIGLADENASLKMASTYKDHVYLDTEAEFSSALAITSVPTVMIADEKGTIVDKDLPAHLVGNVSEDDLVDVWIKRTLKLNSYFQ